ncbi:MAG: N-acetylglucosamine-6-phosphate deacetylase [Actinomycetota bacterium]
MGTLALGAELILGPPGARWLEIEAGRIVRIHEGSPPSGAERLGGFLAPGFLDLQVNGLGTVNFASAKPEDWRKARLELICHGVTGFCPTFVSSALSSYPDMLRSTRAARQDESPGAEILGAHMEGPFLGGKPGAHPPEFLQLADPKWIAGVLEDHPGLVSIVTLAPEADPNLEATRLLAEAGVLVSLGHSAATYHQAVDAANAGARAVTHLFNAMRPLHHREPGLAGAALDDERLTPTLIADLVHVHPAALRLAIDRKPNVALVSDAVAAQSEEARDRGVRVIDGAPRLEDGTLAGSQLTLDVAVANLAGIGISIQRAVEMATAVPAAILGLRDRGRIEVGMRADFVLLDPDSMHVLEVWLEGEKVYG